MYYHASQIADIEVLEPRTSNHNTPLIYFLTKRENVLVYLSNAIEKHCKETGFTHDGKWHKWASYGFESDGTLRIDEYYPNAIEDTYKGVSGVATGSLLMQTVTMIITGLSMGVTIYVGQKIGEKKDKEVGYCKHSKRT